MVCNNANFQWMCRSVNNYSWLQKRIISFDASNLFPGIPPTTDRRSVNNKPSQWCKFSKCICCWNCYLNFNFSGKWCHLFDMFLVMLPAFVRQLFVWKQRRLRYCFWVTSKALFEDICLMIFTSVVTFFSLSSIKKQ